MKTTAFSSQSVQVSESDSLIRADDPFLAAPCDSNCGGVVTGIGVISINLIKKLGSRDGLVEGCNVVRRSVHNCRTGIYDSREIAVYDMTIYNSRSTLNVPKPITNDWMRFDVADV